MADSLPSLTRTLDDQFTETWQEIQTEAIDNILDASPITAMLRRMGVFTTQTGGDIITRTIRYGKKTAAAISEGDVLPQGVPKLKTQARWTWRYIASDIERSVIEDQQNAGKYRIISYVEDRLGAARDGLEEKLEDNFTSAIVTGETGNEMQSLHDLVPPVASRSTGTYGGIARPGAYTTQTNGTAVPTTTNTNPWWGPKYLGASTDPEITLVDDMTVLFNTVSNNKQSPNMIVSDQSLFEKYEGFGQDATQIVKDAGAMAVDLGFTVQRFKGVPWIWTEDFTAEHMVMLNTSFIELVYDPQLWFEMTEWKPIALQGERIAHIFLALNLIGTQPRRHGRLEYS